MKKHIVVLLVCIIIQETVFGAEARKQQQQLVKQLATLMQEYPGMTSNPEIAEQYAQAAARQATTGSDRVDKNTVQNLVEICRALMVAQRSQDNPALLAKLHQIDPEMAARIAAAPAASNALAARQTVGPLLDAAKQDAQATTNHADWQVALVPPSRR